jgi:hypothetical protein
MEQHRTQGLEQGAKSSGLGARGKEQRAWGRELMANG